MIVMAMAGMMMMGVHSAILLDKAADSALVDPHMVFDTMSESTPSWRQAERVMPAVGGTIGDRFAIVTEKTFSY